jgi:hypothetical protein
VTIEEIMTTAGLSWRYVDTASQANLTYRGDREATADEATLYTEDGAALVVMRRTPEMRASGRLVHLGFWSPHHSELLDAAALARVPTVFEVAELDVELLLDIETESVRS